MKELSISLMSLLLLLVMIGIKTKTIFRLNKSSFYSITVLGYIITRFILVIIMYMLLNRQGPGDLLDVFFPQAFMAKYGRLVYNDFESSYALLFPYLLSLPLFLWEHHLSIVLFFIFFEILVLFISVKYIIPQFEIGTRDFLWIFTFCPINVMFTVYYAQDEIILAFFMVLAFALLINKKQFFATIVLILGFYFTKLISVYFFIPLLLTVEKKYLFLFIVGILIPNAIIYSVGVDLLMPLAEGKLKAIGPNIWSLLGSLKIVIDPKISYVFLLLSMGVLVLIQFRIKHFWNKNKFEINSVLNFILLYSFVFMSFSTKSFSFYFLIIIVFYLILILNYLKDKQVSLYQLMTKYDHNLSPSLLYIFLLSVSYIFSKVLWNPELLNFASLFSYIVILFTFIIQLKLIYTISGYMLGNQIKKIRLF